MMDEDELDSAIEYAFRFGEIAIMKGFVTAQQLETALDEQVAHDLSSDHHKLIGEILFEKGWMTQYQIASVLEELIKNKNHRFKAS